jgi:hypothetical protein
LIYFFFVFSHFYVNPKMGNNRCPLFIMLTKQKHHQCLA